MGLLVLYCLECFALYVQVYCFDTQARGNCTAPYRVGATARRLSADAGLAAIPVSVKKHSSGEDNTLEY